MQIYYIMLIKYLKKNKREIPESKKKKLITRETGKISM